MHKASDGRIRTLGPWTALFAGLMGAGTGCGDGPICGSEIVLIITSVADGDTVTTDVSPDPGIQMNIPVRSNLKLGDRVTLTVLDDIGTELGQMEAEADADGDILFENVDVPDGLAILRAQTVAGDCGAGFDEVQINVSAGGACGLSIREGLLESDFYAPLPVLNASNDADSDLPNFQANVEISTSPGYAVELFVLDIDSAVETSAGTITADGLGVAAFPLTLGQGRQTLRATCGSSSGSQSASSPTTAFIVDTVVPTCSFTYPTGGTSIIPDMDIDPDAAGTQITLIGNANVGNEDDVEGEIAAFTVDGTSFDGSLLDIDGNSTLDASFDMVGSFELTFSTQDHAGNTCSVTQMSNYVTDGCSIVLSSPTGPVLFDSDPGTPGVQVDIEVDVDPACEGQTVTTDCGLDTTEAIAISSDFTTLPVTACNEEQCELVDPCTVSVTSLDGITTSVGTALTVDNAPPPVILQFIDPVTMCGGAIPPENDVDPVTDGVQIDVRVVAPGADTREVDVGNPSNPPPVFAGDGGDATITLEPGLNDIIAVARDAFGNEARTDTCEVALLDIVIGFAAPVDDGLVGSPEGSVNGNQITFNLCGTVNTTGTTVDVSIDGGAAQPATVMGTTWCVNSVTLDESDAMNPFHTIDVSATTGVQFGQGATTVVVDLTPPGPIGGFAASVLTRQSADLAWTAPDNDGAAATAYIIRVANVPLNDANFDSTGTVLASPIPSAPGGNDTLLVEQLDAGTEYYFGVASLDTAGNRSVAQTAGPAIPDFTTTGEFAVLNDAAGDNSLGYQIAHGDFNGDGFSDIAVGAPFMAVDLNNSGGFEGTEFGTGAVAIYFGSVDGIDAPANPPDILLLGTEGGGQFGNGVASIEWGGDASTDLAIGAPFAGGFNGRVFVFHGGTPLSTATGPNDANVTINASSSSGWFGFGGFGWTLASANFDTDGVADLVIAVVGANSGVGGMAVVYGGHTQTTITLDENNAALSGDAKTLAITDPDPTTFDLFGQTLVNLGRTQGGSDADDDIGIAYQDGDSVFVIRGRPQPVDAGVTISTVNLTNDLELQDDSVDTMDVRFGSSLGSISDVNGDGARDIVIGAWAEGDYDGRVLIVDGDEVGTQSVSNAFTRITPFNFTERHFGAGVLNNASAGTSADVNNDGVEDLLMIGGGGDDVALYIWYGNAVPMGDVLSNSAAHVITGPAAFDSNITSTSGTPMIGIWSGDVNNDGLEDITWADFTANSLDGTFEVLWR